jgi:hypothetical protein
MTEKPNPMKCSGDLPDSADLLFYVPYFDVDVSVQDFDVGYASG